MNDVDVDDSILEMDWSPFYLDVSKQKRFRRILWTWRLALKVLRRTKGVEYTIALM